MADYTSIVDEMIDNKPVTKEQTELRALILTIRQLTSVLENNVINVSVVT